jgi:hypothetical protein
VYGSAAGLGRLRAQRFGEFSPELSGRGSDLLSQPLVAAARQGRVRKEASERSEASHRSGARPSGRVSDCVGESEGRSPSEKNWRRREFHMCSSVLEIGEKSRSSGQTADARHFRRLHRFPAVPRDCPGIHRICGDIVEAPGTRSRCLLWRLVKLSSSPSRQFQM